MGQTSPLLFRSGSNKKLIQKTKFHFQPHGEHAGQQGPNPSLVEMLSLPLLGMVLALMRNQISTGISSTHSFIQIANRVFSVKLLPPENRTHSWN